MARYLTLPVLLLLALHSFAQIAFRDPDHDMTKGSTLYRADHGQNLTTDGDPLTGMAAKSEGPNVAIYCGQESDLHFIWRAVHQDSAVADTSFHISMHVSGEAGADVAPDPSLLAPGIANYYHGTDRYENVPAYHAYHYSEVNPRADMRVYHGGYGPKLAFIFNYGSDPEDLLLEFAGQDNLKVGVQGALKVYMRGQYL